MEDIDDNILKWNNLFIKYCEYENKCVENINAIEEIKKNLKNLLGNQKKDDLLFYKSLIESSHYYLSNSLKIRKLKLLKDLNYILSCIDEQKQIDEVNINNFTILINDYNNMTKKNNTTLTWVKNNDLEKDINEILEYHIKLIEFFSLSVELEKSFYCGK
jgi:hypothetical protein